MNVFVFPSAFNRIALKHFPKQVRAPTRAVHFLACGHVAGTHRAALVAAALSDSNAAFGCAEELSAVVNTYQALGGGTMWSVPNQGGVLGPVLFIAVFLVEGATRPGYSAWHNHVSLLATGDGGWMQVANFLVESSSRKAFLDFVGYGMQNGWDGAAQAYYRFSNVNQLEQAWIDSLRKPKRPAPALIASNTTNPSADQATRVVVRLTAPPVQPLAEDRAAIFRAQAPEPEPEQGGGWSDLPRQQAASRPGYLPDHDSTRDSSIRTYQNTQPAAVPADPWRPAVRLGAPQFESQPAARLRNVASGPSPVGYPYR